MKLDRLVLDIFDWVRRLIWHRKGEVKQKPYAVLQTWRGTLGVLNKIERDTPRAIATYTFMPFRYHKPKEEMIDTHVFLDTLSLPSGKSSKRTTRKFTHRITIIKASHWVRPDTSYEADPIYMKEWDFQGRTQYPHRYAQQITLYLAKQLLLKSAESISWDQEIETYAKRLMGSAWTNTSRHAS